MSNESTQLPNDEAQRESTRAGIVGPTNAFIAFEKPEIEQTIADRFEQQAAMYPERIAIRTPNSTLTYNALDKAANRIAWAILDRLQQAEVPVALLFENDAPFVTATIAALKAGTIQVALESTFPKARLRYILEQSQARVIVTDGKNLSLARQLSSLPTINIDELESRFCSTSPKRDLRPDAIAAIAYTSGSTGEPKGIVWNHRGVLHAVMRHTNTNHVCAKDRLVTFRATLRPALYALLNGATCYPVDLQATDTAELSDWLMRERITVYRAAVSAFRSFAGSLTGKEKFPDLRLILLFGEAVHRSDVELYKKHFSDGTILGSSLGCSEFDDYASYFVDKETALPGIVVPGGYPIADTKVLILDERGDSLGVDQIGEIVIHSRYNAAGYWRRSDLTEAAFTTDPVGGDKTFYHTGDLGRRGLDGCLYHHGRRDLQVKIRGYRVDISEVEAALLEIEGIREAAVVGREIDPGDCRLAAYIVVTEAAALTILALRQKLMGKLPDYMVPWSIICVDSMPLTATGKVDRRALPMPAGTRPAMATPYRGPRTATEKQLAGIWAEVLALQGLGIDDNFLELGGDSLLAMQIISRVLARFRVTISQRALFDAATIAEMAKLIDDVEADSPASPNIHKRLTSLESFSNHAAHRLLAQFYHPQRK